jgi:AcrR family transcriptional regulator
MSSSNVETRSAELAPEARSDIEDRILDAAERTLQLAHARRPAVAEIARQVGVSRPTIYRYFTDIDAVIRALWDREIRRVLATVPRAGNDRGALVRQVVELADRISTHQTLSRTFSTEAPLIAHYIVDRLGTGQLVLLQTLADAIRAIQPAGTIRPGDPDELAAMTLLVAQSAVQSRSMIAAHLPGDAWRRELTHALNGYLQP